MNLASKTVLPKVQMIVNGLLAQSDQNQLNFTHEEYSIQVKNSYHLMINFYEPQLQDIQWNLQFLGVSSLKHVVVSYEGRKKIRIVMFRNNRIYFFQGQVRSRQSRLKLKSQLLQNERFLPLSLKMYQNVSFISEDLFPKQSIGIFLIATSFNRFFVLKANDRKLELIDLTKPHKIVEIVFNISSLLSSFSNQEIVSEQKVISNLLIESLDERKQSFKAVILQNFDIRVNFVNIPMLQSQKSENHIRLLNQFNFQERIKKGISQGGQFMIISSRLYKVKMNQIGVLFLVRALQNRNVYFLVSIKFDIQVGLIDTFHYYAFDQREYFDIEFEKIPEEQILIVKVQQRQELSLIKMSLQNLQIMQIIRIRQKINSRLAKSKQQNKLLLLTPFHLFNINMKEEQVNQIMDKSDIEMQDQSQIHHQNQQKTSLRNQLQSMQIKINQNWRKNKYGDVLQNLLSLQDLVGSELRNVVKIKADLNDKNMRGQQIQVQNIQQHIQQLIQTHFSISFCRVFIYQVLNQVQNDVEIMKLFDQILRNRKINQIQQIIYKLLQNCEIDIYLNIWTKLFQNLRARQFYLSHLVKNKYNNFLNHNFSSAIHQSIQKFINEKSSKDQMNQGKLKSLVDFFIVSVGIIEIFRQIYRQLINKKLFKKYTFATILKEIAFKQNNFNLINLLYFQTDQIQQYELKNYLQQLIKLNNTSTIQIFLSNLISQLKQKQKQRKLNHQIHKIYQITSILQNHIGLIHKYLQFQNSDLFILIGLKLGYRKQIYKSTIQVSNRMETENNKQKLQLTLIRNQIL